MYVYFALYIYIYIYIKSRIDGFKAVYALKSTEVENSNSHMKRFKCKKKNQRWGSAENPC